MLPIGTNIRPRRTPYANYVLIGINVAVFLIQFGIDPLTGMIAPRAWVRDFMLDPQNRRLWQFVTYAFLHGGFMHILGNMYFLYLFGNSINDRLGSAGYICFYLAGAVFSGIGHVMVSTVPVLGASGAVAAVTGAYLVFFPRSLITVVYWFIFIGTIELPALYFIALKMMLIDNIIARGTQNVAYDAHLAGYAFGIAVTLALLATGKVTSGHYDLWLSLKQWNRRRRFSDAVSSGYDPFRGRAYSQSDPGQAAGEEASEPEEVVRLRKDIDNYINQKNIAAAADAYLLMAGIDSRQLPPRRYLLDIANQLAGEKRYSEAADAYEKLIHRYSSRENIEQVELMLGIIYARYLNKPEKAADYLKSARQRLTEPGQIRMCSEELEKL